MSAFTLKRLDSGYWHARWNRNQWIQWPVGRAPTEQDCFGWVTPQMIKAAAVRAEEET